MKSVDLMLEEHRLIERMLNVLEACAGRMERGHALESGTLDSILEFLRVYADAGHHAKEEDVFFPALAAQGFEPEASAVNALQAQHEGGRGLLRELREAMTGVRRGNAASRQAFAATAMEYVALLREHIRLEDHYFPDYASTWLTSAEDDAVLARMLEADRSRGLDATRYRGLVAECEEALRRS